MPRTKAFDTEQALDRALHLFWRQGYENTSVQDLVDTMGINRGSLYDTFGDKHSLYILAVEKYLSVHSLHDVRAAVAREDADPKTILTELLQRLAREASGPDRARGCLLTNTIVEIGKNDAEITSRIRTAIENMVVLLTTLISEGQKLGQFRRDRDPKALAMFVVNTMQGLRVLSKIHDDDAGMKDVVDETLNSLLQPH